MTGPFTSATFSHRNLRSMRGGLLVLGVVVLIATAGVAAWPRVTSGLLTSDLQYRAASASASVRDLQSSVDGATDIPPTANNFGGGQSLAPTWAAMPEALTQARAAMGGQLRSITRPGYFVGRADGTDGSGVQASGAPHAPVNSVFNLSIEANPRLGGDTVLVAGAWPAVPTLFPGPDPLQVAITSTAAKTLGWKVGETQTFKLTDSSLQTVVLAGTLRPRDPAGDYWQLDPSRAEASYVSSPDGDLKSYHGVVWVNAQAWTRIGLNFGGEAIRSWYPVEATHLRVDTLPSLSANLQKFLSNPYEAGAGEPPVLLRYSTNLAGVIQDFDDRARPASALLAVVGTGPLGTGLAVVLLGVILLVDRRSTALALVRSRGSTLGRARIMVACETAVASVPAALVGGIVGAAFTTGPITFLVIASIVACGVLLPVVAAVRVNAPVLKPTRAGLVGRGRWRWTAEVLLIGLAVLGLIILAQRGLSTGGSTGTGPLLTITPLLVSAAACVIVLRFFPFALAWVGRVLRPTRGVVGYVGWATSARARPRFLPLFAVIAGVSVAIFSLTVLTTERAGIQDAALAQIGADVSVTGAPITPKVEKELRGLPAVATAASIISAGGISMDGVSDNVALYTADPSELNAVQSALPSPLRMFRLLGSTSHGRTVTIAGGFQQRPPASSHIEAETPVPVSVHAVDGSAGKFISAVPWLVIATNALPTSAKLPHQTAAMLLQLKPGADVAKARSAVRNIAGTGAIVSVTPTVVAELRAAPIVSGMEQLILAALALSALMCAIALVVTLIMNSDERIRLLARLRVLGFTRRQSTGLSSWELGPMSVLGLVAGVAVGIVLPVAILASVNLAGFTGSAIRPLLVVDPVLILATVVAFLIAAILATIIAIVLARRASPAAVLRATGEE